MSSPDESVAAPTVDQLRAQLAAAEQAAAEAAAAREEVHPAPSISSSAPSDIRAALAGIHDRLVAIEAHLGL